MSGLVHSNIRKLAVDITVDASVEAAVKEIYDKEGRLDVAIANAGVGLTSRSTSFSNVVLLLDSRKLTINIPILFQNLSSTFPWNKPKLCMIPMSLA
jgi:NAD(P)-dependent dehydrogenase (short-subunit alcohol dehydrogenase family)